MPRSDRGATFINCSGELKGIAPLGLTILALAVFPLDTRRVLCQTFYMDAATHPMLNIELSRAGILGQSPLVAKAGRELTIEDLGLVATTKVNSTQVLKRLRASHHQAARLLAQGCRPGEVSALTGFCLSRISVLQSDPTFADLVKYYEGVAEARFADVQERMVVLGLSASEEILDRLENDPELISTKELVDVIKAGLDRGGHAPVAKSETKSLSVVLGADDLAALKANSSSIILDKAAIYGQNTEEKDNTEKSVQASEEPAVGEAGPDRPLRIKLAETKGLPSKGTGI